MRTSKAGRAKLAASARNSGSQTRRAGIAIPPSAGRHGSNRRRHAVPKLPRFWIFAVAAILLAGIAASFQLPLLSSPQYSPNAGQLAIQPVLVAQVPEGAVQQPAVIGQPVKWVSSGQSLAADAARPLAATGMVAASAQSEFYTEAPKATETRPGPGVKLITISSGMHYTNVEAFTSLPSEVPASAVSLYHIDSASGAREPVSFRPVDTNGNGLVDRVEWVVPHLSTETYEVVIATEAEHLDSSRGFVEDVYGQVKARDGNWASIPSGDYLRATFERNLTSGNDITIYARPGSMDINGTAVPNEIFQMKQRIDEIRGLLG